VPVAQRTPAELNALDPEALKTLVLAQQSELASQQIEIDNLKLLIFKLKRMQFGRRSEKLDSQVQQLELLLEDLEMNEAASEPAPIDPATVASTASTPKQRRKPARRPLPPALPRETVTHAPKQEACPDCGGKLRPLGEDVAETLEYVPAHFKVIRTVRPKLSCACCSRIVQEPAPSRPIDRGLAGPGLLAHVLVAKYADHLPLYRQAEIYEREGVELDRSTLADWVGGASRMVMPLVDAVKKYVLSGSKLHGDDVPVPVLAPSLASWLALRPSCVPQGRRPIPVEICLALYPPRLHHSQATSQDVLGRQGNTTHDEVESYRADGSPTSIGCGRNGAAKECVDCCESNAS
jgi:transposase